MKKCYVIALTILGAMMPANVTIFSGGGPVLCLKYKFCFVSAFTRLSLDEHQTDDDGRRRRRRTRREREKNDLDGRDDDPFSASKTKNKRLRAYINKEKRTVGPALATINTVSPLGTALTVPRSHPVTGIGLDCSFFLFLCFLCFFF